MKGWKAKLSYDRKVEAFAPGAPEVHESVLLGEPAALGSGWLNVGR